jgi:hypothetical protein
MYSPVELHCSTTLLLRCASQALPIRRVSQISATESMYVNEVRFRLIPITSVWRVTFVTFCIYVGEKRELGVILWSLNCQFVTIKHVHTTCTAQCHTAFLSHQYCKWMTSKALSSSQREWGTEDTVS